MERQKITFDFKLMMGYHISMIILFTIGILPVKVVFSIALCLIVVLSLSSVIHKRINGWLWHKPDLKGIGMSILSIVGGMIFIFVFTNIFGGIKGPIAPWVCAGIGIIYFNFLAGLNLADKTKDEFDARTSKAKTTETVKEGVPDKFKRLKIIFKVMFFISWFAGIYLFYSYSEYTKTYSKEKNKFKTVKVQSHGKKYYVNQNDKELITTKSIIIIPFFGLSILFPLIMKFGFGIDLMSKKEEKREYR